MALLLSKISTKNKYAGSEMLSPTIYVCSKSEIYNVTNPLVVFSLEYKEIKKKRGKFKKSSSNRRRPSSWGYAEPKRFGQL